MVMQHPFLEALRNGKTELAAQILIEQLKKNGAQPSLITETKLIIEELNDKIRQGHPEQDLQRIQEHYASKILDIWEKYESFPNEQISSKAASSISGYLLKALLFLIVFSLVLIALEMITW